MTPDLTCYGDDIRGLADLVGDFDFRSPMDIHAWYRVEWQAIAELLGFSQELETTLAPLRVARDRVAATNQAGVEAPQALRGHRPADPLRDAGQADLTTHVDFAAFAAAARQAGATAFGPVEQGAFLRSLGIEQRAAMLAEKAGAEDRAAIATALHRLIAPAQMGSLFKALALASPDLPQLAGFA